MNVTDLVRAFLNNPFPLWETAMTKELVADAWKNIESTRISSPIEYNTSLFITDGIISKGGRISILNRDDANSIYLEQPIYNTESGFYFDHGLILENKYSTDLLINKLNSAFETLAKVDEVEECLIMLIRSIQVLKQEHDEIDLSYSNPAIPFSVFVSLCEEPSDISNLRVAESLLHEAMHLKLTLVENIVPLVIPNTGNLFYSPWRDEKRPARGVLHGLFVFKSIVDFFKILQNKSCVSINVREYLNQREMQLKEEIYLLKDFYLCSDLTKDGAILTKNLLP